MTTENTTNTETIIPVVEVKQTGFLRRNLKRIGTGLGYAVATVVVGGAAFVLYKGRGRITR